MDVYSTLTKFIQTKLFFFDVPLFDFLIFHSTFFYYLYMTCGKCVETSIEHSSFICDIVHRLSIECETVTKHVLGVFTIYSVVY